MALLPVHPNDILAVGLAVVNVSRGQYGILNNRLFNVAVPYGVTGHINCFIAGTLEYDTGDFSKDRDFGNHLVIAMLAASPPQARAVEDGLVGQHAHIGSRKRGQAAF